MVEDDSISHDFERECSRYRPNTNEKGSIIGISLIQTCKQIYAETRILLWKLNTVVTDLSDSFYMMNLIMRRRHVC